MDEFCMLHCGQGHNDSIGIAYCTVLMSGIQFFHRADNDGFGPVHEFHIGTFFWRSKITIHDLETDSF